MSADLKNLKFNKKEILCLSEQNQKKHFGFVFFPFLRSNYSQYDDNHTGEVVMSDSNSFFVINFDVHQRDKEKHKIFVFDNAFEKVYDQLIEKNIKDRYVDYESIEIDDNNGTVYFLGKFFENESRKSKIKNKTNYHFELYKLDANGQSIRNFKNEDKFISSLELLKSKNRISCIGFYGNKNDRKVNGVSLFNLNPETLSMEKEKFTPFSNQFLTDKYGNNEDVKERIKSKGIKNVDFKSVYIYDNGDIIINAEEFYITINTNLGINGATASNSVYHFDDILSIRIDKDGNLKWARNIKKQQTGVLNSSYISIPVGEDSYYFINCSDRIKKIGADRISFKQTNSKKSNLYVIKINKDGDIDFKKLIDDKESEVYYKVNDGNVNIDNQTVILTGERKKIGRILKLKI